MLLNDIKWSEELSARDVLRRGLPPGLVVKVAEGIYGDTPGNTLAAGQVLYLRRLGRLLETLGWVQSIPPDMELTTHQLQKWDLCFLGHALQTSLEGSQERVDKAVTVVRFDFDLHVCEKVGGEDPVNLTYRLDSILDGVKYDAIGSDTDQTYHEYINLASGEGEEVVYDATGLRDTDNKPSLPSRQPANPTRRSFSAGDNPDQSTRKQTQSPPKDKDTPPPRPPKSDRVRSMSLSHTGGKVGGGSSVKARPLPPVAVLKKLFSGGLPSPTKPAPSLQSPNKLAPSLSSPGKLASSIRLPLGEPVSPPLLPVKEAELDESNDDDDGYEKIVDWKLDEVHRSRKGSRVPPNVSKSIGSAKCEAKPSAVVKPTQAKTSKDIPLKVPEEFEKLSSKGLADVLRKLKIDEASVKKLKDKGINGGCLSMFAGVGGFRMLKDSFEMSVIDIHLLQKHIFDGWEPDEDSD